MLYLEYEPYLRSIYLRHLFLDTKIKIMALESTISKDFLCTKDILNPNILIIIYHIGLYTIVFIQFLLGY